MPVGFSPACEAARFTVAGALEPATHVGGGTFDWGVDRDTMQLSVTDAIGHDVEAALLATRAVGALRRAGRACAELEGQAREANQAAIDNGRRGFVTGQLLHVSLRDGEGRGDRSRSGSTVRCPPSCRLSGAAVGPAAG